MCIRGSRVRNVNEMEKKKYADDSNDIEYVYGISINKEWIVDCETGL